MRLLLLTTVAVIPCLSLSAQAGDKNALEDKVFYDDLKVMDERVNKRASTVSAPSPVILPAQNTEQSTSSNRLKPRIEFNHRYSNDRAITMGEFWVPIVQNEVDGSVLYGDVRVMGDNNENDEYNAGLGYRQVINTKLLGEGVAGAHVWYDRRLTARDSKFNQVTTGLEWLGEQYDFRLNGYMPFNKVKRHTQANPNGSGVGFVGNQILVNTDQSIVEEALPGLDLELGARINFLDSITDSTRIYAGGYHFEGDRVDNVTGVRTRIASDITSDIQVGARYQHDDIRGSQTYLEATVRFPFKAKKSFKKHGVRSRLDESPERDIDIVSNEEVVDQGLMNTPLLNATTGITQNVIHVDNTNGAGTGTAEDPFNTLAAAEGAAGVNDLIYVHRGDGTTTGQNAGITVDDAGQMLAGSGADLSFSTKRFATSNGLNVTGVLVPASQSPVITNGAGNSVDVTADDVFVSGITVDGAGDKGVYVLNADNVIISYVRALNSVDDGIQGDFNDGGTYTFSMINNIANNNGDDGLDIRTAGATRLNTKVSSNQVTSNNGDGIFIQTINSSRMNLIVSDNQTILNDDDGIDIRVLNTSYMNATIANNHTEKNDSDGFQLYPRNDSTALATLADNVFNDNNDEGVELDVRNNAALSVSARNNVFTNNAEEGFVLEDFSTRPAVFDFGGGPLLNTPGNNSIFNNYRVATTNSDIQVEINNSQDVYLSGNFWGDPDNTNNFDPRKGSKDQVEIVNPTTTGIVDTSDFLLKDPNN